MTTQPKSRAAVLPIAVGLGLIALIAVVAVWRAKRGNHLANTTPAVAAATQPTKPAHATNVPAAPKDGSYLDVVRAAYPDFPATQPLGVPLELSQAAHLILHDPIYYCGSGRPEMWITRADAPPVETVLTNAVDPDQDVDVHVLRERIVFVHWALENGTWVPFLVSEKRDGGFDVISIAHGRQTIPAKRGYHWNHAMSWNDKVVIPTEHGISIFHFGSQLNESYHELATSNRTTMPTTGPVVYAEPQMLLDSQGLLAWLPWQGGKTGGLGAARYVEPDVDQTSPSQTLSGWTDLTPANGWPAKLLHLVPLLDGTVMMLVVDDHDAVQVQYNTLEHTTVDEQAIGKLVEQLSDGDETVRNAAYDKLSQYGSGIWPILEKLMDDQGPEAQARMRQLLKQKVVPTLNGMALLGDKTLKLVARLGDGGTVFFAQAGVSIPHPDYPDAAPDYRVPAWISVRPGHPIELLPDSFTSELTAGSNIYVNGNDLLVSNDVRGPRRFVGNGFVNLLRKSEHAFSDFVGMDRRGRWIFRKPIVASTTAPSTGDGETLIIDPTLPDPVPRLPVWILNTADEVGWTKDGWPVTKKNSAYALHEEAWQQVGEKEQIFEKPEEVPPQIEPIPAGTTASTAQTWPTSRQSSPLAEPATKPTTVPATTQAAETPILTDRNGTQYFGGITDLRLVPLKGRPISWTLPAIATGKGSVWLVRAPDGCLFLFNQPGRIVRIKPTPMRSEPFAVEKIFTHRVPTIDHPTRIWLDPGGRIDMAWENQLAIFFPAGYIPRPIAEMMLTNDQDDEE